MKSIAFVVPYFGVLPKGFAYWLMSCETNSTIDWLIFTDDHTKYNYPQNVKVTYCSFSDIQKKAQKLYDFKISLKRPYKLCDFKPTYGELFAEELRGYDFWGHCDIDLVWGNIRKFFTDDILSKYEKIGNQGHCTIYKNTPEVNARYRTIIPGGISYKEVLGTDKGFAFDEPPMEHIYNYLGIDYYREVNYIHLTKYDYGFFLGLKPKEENYKNKNHIMSWENGSIKRYYLEDVQIKVEEYMYLHFWCRPMTYPNYTYRTDKKYLMYPERVKQVESNYKVTVGFIKRKSIRNPVRFYAKSIWFNRHKITWKRIVFNIKGRLNYSRKGIK